MSYRAPVEDILATMRHVAGLDRLIADGLAPELDGDMAQAVLDEAAKFAGDVLAPLNRIGDKHGSVLKDGVVTTPPGWKDAYTAWAGAGWNALPAPAEHGGQGLPALLQSACIEMWNSAAFAFALGPLLTVGAIEALHAHGSEHLKETYLPKLVSGEWMGTMNLTEPQAGSDLNALRAKAEPVGDGTYKITGTEDLHHLRRSRDDGQHRPSRAGAPARCASRHARHIAIPRAEISGQSRRFTLGVRNDVICAGVEHKLGIHASPTCVHEIWREGRRHRLSDRRRKSRPQRACSSMMNNGAPQRSRVQGVAIAERADAAGACISQKNANRARTLDAVKAGADGTDHRACRYSAAR